MKRYRVDSWLDVPETIEPYAYLASDVDALRERAEAAEKERDYLRDQLSKSEAVNNTLDARLDTIILQRNELRQSLQDAYDEMKGHGWYCETFMAAALSHIKGGGE